MKFSLWLRALFCLFFLLNFTTIARAESLRAALASAYGNNPQIAAALLSVKASAEDIALRRAGIMPQINASAEVSTSWVNINGNIMTPSKGTIGMSYSQTLFDNLKTEAQIEQARAYTEVAKQNLRSATQNVLLSAATAYLNVVRETRLVQLRAENVAFYQEQVRSSEDRLAIGTGTRTAVSQAKARLAQGISSYKSAINDLRTAQANYQRWIGHKPKNLELKFDFGAILPDSLDEAQDYANRLHPAILSAKAQLRAAQSGAEAAKAAFGPTLRLIGNIGGEQDFVSGQVTPSASIRISLSVPIYQGGALGASVRKANLNQIKSEVDVLSAQDQVRAAIVSAWSGLQNAKAQIEAAKSAVYSSQQVLDGIIEEQRVGQRTMLDVLNAKSDLTKAQESLIIAHTNKYIASFSLIAAMGRLSAGDLSLPVNIYTPDGYIAKVEDVWQDLRKISE